MKSFKNYAIRCYAVLKGNNKLKDRPISLTTHLKYISAMMLVLMCALVTYATKFDIVVHAWTLNVVGTALPYWKVVTYAGEGWVQVLFCYAVSFAYYRNASYIKAKFWFWAGPISLLAGVAGQVVKRSLGRPRPRLFDQLGVYDFQWLEMSHKMHSFPSGHTLTTFAIVAVVAHLYPKLKYVMLVFAAFVGLSRVAVGMHWFADVVAGAFLGYILGKYFSAVFLKRESK